MSPYAPFARSMYIMLKPVGSKCNLACDYCYYLEKEHLYSQKSQATRSSRRDGVMGG